jgi:YggT family protein
MVSGTSSPHPALTLVWQLTEPLLGPARRILPPLGGLDFSPLIVILVMTFLLDALYAALKINVLVASVVVGL